MHTGVNKYIFSYIGGSKIHPNTAKKQFNVICQVLVNVLRKIIPKRVQSNFENVCTYITSTVSLHRAKIHSQIEN